MRKNKHPTNNYLLKLDEVFFGLSEADVIEISEDYSPDEIYKIRKYLKDDVKIVYTRKYNICPECGGRLVKNGTLKRFHNKDFDLYYQTYKCTSEDCNTFINASTEEYKDKWCNYSNEFKEKGVELSYIAPVSYDQKSELIYLENGNHIPRNTVYANQMQKAPPILEQNNKIIEEEINKHREYFSGIYHYDEQYVQINGKLHLRVQLIDAVTNFPFKDKFILAKDFEPESIKAYIKESIKDLPLNTIVSDGHLAYPKIMQELGANQQVANAT